MQNTTPLPTLPVYQTLTETIQEAHDYGDRAKNMLSQLIVVIERLGPEEFEDLAVATIQKSIEAVSHANIGMEKALDSLKLKGGAS